MYGLRQRVPAHYATENTTGEGGENIFQARFFCLECDIE
jgi:nitrate reductase cytochrome c-type subunit